MNEPPIKTACQTIDRAMRLKMSEMRKEFSPDTLSIAKGGLDAMMSTITVNCFLYDGEEKEKIHPGKVLNAVIELLKTLDAASDHAAGSTNQQPNTKN